MKIHYLQHVSFEGPGYIETWAKQRGHELTGTHLFNSETLPAPGDIQALVIMGGPMGVYDEQDYPWLKKEKTFIKECINRKKKVLGVCLGAQLIADALGAEVVTLFEKEIGWFPIQWTPSARNHPALDFLPPQQIVVHWHGDMFYRPDGAINLGCSEGCENQGFMLGDYVLGLQFHLEMTQEGLSELIENCRNEINNGQFVQNAEQMLNEGYFEQNHDTMGQLLDRFIQ
ncbi:GMP synthase-Glutamine amidotransferase [Fodinibius roseus]|uniref:GMP synthase-Glutamine amidotransferase n=1 Tax=Fodinibius roseus TaxID=1194090 RepID=A0A1M4UV59_9BACT|nr:type 1 glutamine amidotransferase [Fodinibius roseus]SHE60592.1 GMP synthase-Glutamine amidotransferase [Fodinibius roseus]